MNMNKAKNKNDSRMTLTMRDSLQLVKKKYVEYDDREECEDWCYYQL